MFINCDCSKWKPVPLSLAFEDETQTQTQDYDDRLLNLPPFPDAFSNYTLRRQSNLWLEGNDYVSS